MTRRARNFTAGLALLVLAFVCPDPAGAAPVVTRLDPPTGLVGHVVTLQGSDLAGNEIEVLFGSARASEVRNTGGTNRIIRVLVPNKVDPRDPDTVAVTVTVDGVEATDPGAPLHFTYSIPQPAPEITDFMTGDPSHPRSVIPGEPFVLTLTGSNFLLARRVPQRCIALGGERVEAEALLGSSSDTSVSCSFAGLQVPGDYELLVAFSDGSGAGIAAPDFVGDRRIDGFPPFIQSVFIWTNPQEVVECDFTRIVEGYVCGLGVPGAKADPGVFIGGTFTHTRFQASVTDPDSTPTQSNILLVAASFIHPESGDESSLVLFDDGSFNKFGFRQRASVPEDCPDDESGSCQCSTKNYPITSGDAVANDAVFTRDLAFLDRGTVPLALLQDCIMQRYRDVPVDFVSGTAMEFHIEAVDRQGNLTAWPQRFAVSVGTGAFTCTGDECGCCLLTSADIALDCKGKPGMRSIDFAAGVCMF